MLYSRKLVELFIKCQYFSLYYILDHNKVLI